MDAARKYHDAVAAADAVQVTDCTTYKEKLAKLLYARYRLRRLESYYHMMEAFQGLVVEQGVGQGKSRVDPLAAGSG